MIRRPLSQADRDIHNEGSPWVVAIFHKGLTMILFHRSANHRLFRLLALVALLAGALGSCQPKHPTPAAPTTSVPTIVTPPTQTPAPLGKSIVVINPDDAGPGSLRQALEAAEPYDKITFDPVIFPPDAPVTIAVTNGLPQITQGHLTIDASDAGVILDGSQLAADSWIPGLEIVSDGNTIRGLQVTHFTGTGIVVAGHGQNNTIGGDRNIGLGPIGQGNLTSGNDFGIGLWDSASNNIVTGNLVGTGVGGTGEPGNRSSGMWIETAMKNMIGPDNIVAFNDRCGIQVEGVEALGNALTRNSIHDNREPGICLVNGGNGTIPAPLFFEFDASVGQISGASCAGCTVEIFSDSSDEGAAYEGQVVTDRNGAFSFDKGAAFVYAKVTLTATDADGNTSEFSTPASGARLSVSLQEGNDLPKERIVTGSFGELADNRMGDVFPLDRHPEPCPPAEGDWSFTHMGNLGLKWARLSLDTLELEAARNAGNYSRFEINPCQDEMVTLLSENDITILYTLVYWDENLHAENYPNYKNEEEIQRFLDYARLIVRHFKGRIQYYEILNEALVYVEAPDYVNLVHRVIPVIHEEDPQAKIVVGGATDLRHDYSRDYFFDVLHSDLLPLVDGIATHPMYGVSPQYDETRQYYNDYPSLVQEIKDVASANGFRGEYFVEEMAWRTDINPYPYEPWEYTPVVAAKYYARGIVMNLGMDHWTGIGGERYDTIPPVVAAVRNLSATMAGARPATLPVNIESEASNLMSYAFTAENGDRLLALWTNGIAVDDDPGVSATLTFSGLPAGKVTGIDVLNGFEQELVAETGEGELVIRQLLVKDYPILLRLAH